MSLQSRPTWSANSISLGRCCMRWTELAVRPVARSERRSTGDSIRFSYSSARQGRLGPHRDIQDAINRKSPCPSDHEKSHNREDQQVKLNSFPLLSAGPVHEKAEAAMHSHNCNQHVHTNAERCDSSQESQDESHSPEELGCDRQESKRSWNMHHAREKTHRTCEPEASEPAQQLLRTVREKDNSQHQSQNRRRGAVICGV